MSITLERIYKNFDSYQLKDFTWEPLVNNVYKTTITTATPILHMFIDGLKVFPSSDYLTRLMIQNTFLITTVSGGYEVSIRFKDDINPVDSELVLIVFNNDSISIELDQEGDPTSIETVILKATSMIGYEGFSSFSLIGTNKNFNYGEFSLSDHGEYDQIIYNLVTADTVTFTSEIPVTVLLTGRESTELIV